MTTITTTIATPSCGIPAKKCVSSASNFRQAGTARTWGSRLGPVRPAGLGFGGTWFPVSEYDTEVDRASSWLMKGLPPEDAAARTVRYLERDWGVQILAGKLELLAQGLGGVDLSE